jgi:hypothetical protein
MKIIQERSLRDLSTGLLIERRNFPAQNRSVKKADHLSYENRLGRRKVTAHLLAVNMLHLTKTKVMPIILGTLALCDNENKG